MYDYSIMGVRLSDIMPAESWASFFRCIILVVLVIPLIFWFSRLVRRRSTKRYSAQYGMIFGKIVQYGGLIAVFIAILNEIGFPLSHLLGAAGIAGIAIGFASQTSVSNIISGLFLIAESPFIVGDIIKVQDTTGVVMSVDTLSVKLRTFDNKLIRIPNETIIKTEVTNITRFPIRRVDLEIGVAYKENIARVRDILIEIAFQNPRCLQEPEPLVIFKGYGNSSIDLLFAVWAAKANWLTVKNEILETIKVRFDEEGIEIPFPHVTLYAGKATDPMPVKVIGPNMPK